MGLEQYVVDVVVVVAFAIAIAIDAGIQQRNAQAIVGSTADEHRVQVLPATMLGRFQGAGEFARGLFRDSAGNEVDDPADVLRPVAHRTGPAHHIDAVQVAGGNRCHRQLRLAIRRKCRRHAIDKHGGTRRQARGQAAHANVQGDITATGAIGILNLHTWNLFQDLAHVHGPLFDHGFAPDHRPRTRVVLHHGRVGIAQPVTDHLDVHRGDFHGAFGSGCLRL
ncbi:hypothetical protein D9M71_260640 [compost metagenome]